MALKKGLQSDVVDSVYLMDPRHVMSFKQKTPLKHLFNQTLHNSSFDRTVSTKPHLLNNSFE